MPVFRRKPKALHILVPFLVSRIVLLATGYVSPLFLPLQYAIDQVIMERGWLFSPLRLIDMWVRWDSGWYLSIINQGYRMGESVYVASNLPFFPGFPLLVKALHAIVVPGMFKSEQSLLVVGLLLTNSLFLGALWVLYELAMHYYGRQEVSRRIVWYATLFPTSFFLSSFYSESVFFFFTLLSFWLALRRNWWAAGVVAAVAAATRPNGIVAAIPLAIEYMRVRQWNIKKIDVSILSFAFVPAGLLLFCTHLYLLTGDFFAAFKGHAAWGRSFADMYTTFFHPRNSWAFITQLDRCMAILIGGTGVHFLLKKKPEFVPVGVSALLILSSFIFSGTLDSVSRFAVVTWPIYLLLAGTKKAAYVEYVLMGGMLILQVYLFARFSQVFWVA